MSALNAALYRRGIILWLAVVLLLASRSTHSAPVYDQDTTQIAEYDGATLGCYFNYQRYQEGDRIMTSEPCLNCTCHNRMLMCYLKVCPFTKAIGQDCTVEKRPDQCCPVITCPEVPVQLLTSTTSAPESTEVGFHDNYGCHVDERFYADGAMLPLDHHNPCELCYCIRNRTTCVMQECTLQVAGCKPVYQPGVCCPIKYNCEYDEESSTTIGPTPGLIMTTTLPPGILPQCYYEGKVYEDGDLIYSTQPCQHCYCFRGEIACAVQNCGTPMQEHGKNCTALPPPEGECCPTIYECEEEITTVRDEGEEQFPEQVSHGQMTESPILIEDQQTKGEHPQEEAFPGIDNNIPYAQEEEDKTVQGTIEHITQGHIPSTEKPEEETATLPTEKIETTTAEKEIISSHEYVTETSSEITSEKAEEVPSETEATKLGAPTTAQGTEESLVTEASATELPEVSSIAEGLQPEEELTTEHVPKEHISTEENVLQEEHSTPAVTERGQSIEPSISETTQTESPIKEEETTSLHEELSTQTQEEIIQEEQIGSEKPESTTEAIEKTTLPIEELGISTVSESVSEQPKADEGKSETMPSVLLATETESPKEEEMTSAHEISSTEQITTEKEEVSHPIETVTEQSTEISGPSKEQPIEEQKSVISEGEKEQRPEKTTSEHAIIEEQATVGAKKEDAGLTESSVISEEPLVTEVSHIEEKSTPEIPAQSPTSIPIPERSPEQKAEDESVYHVTEDYHGVTHPEISPDNLITEVQQKIPVTHLPQEQETTLTPSEETAKPIATEGIEVSMEETTKPIEEITEINLPTERKHEITTVSEEIQSTFAVTEVQISTESSTAIITQRIPEEEAEKSTVPEETVSEVPQTEIQLTEKSPSTEEMFTKELEESSESSGEVSSEKEVQPKKEEETQPPIVTEPETAPEISTTIPAEHSTVPSDLEKEHTTEGEYVTTVISSTEQSTEHAPQVEEKETEIVPIEKEEPITEKSVEEHITEHPITTSGIIGEKEKELQTEEPVLKEEQTTEAIKTIEMEGEYTTRVSAVEERITEQYSTKKALEEAAVTESHGPEETESTKVVSTESAKQQTTVTEKEPTEETVELKPTEITGIEQTELPVEHITEAGKIEEEGEEKISVPISTEGIQTIIPEIETETTETTAEPEKKQTETSIGGVPSQPPIPSDRKEDQEPIEPELNEEQLTQKPEKEITETNEEPQKPTVLPEEEISYIPSSEGTITESVLPEEKPVEGSTTESVTVGEVITPEQPEISSEQPEEVTTEPFRQEEQTQEPITEKQPEIHEKTEIEAFSPATHEESSTSEVPIESVEDIGVSKTTETAESEGTTIPILISEATELPGLEEFTKHEVPVEKEVTPVTESIPSEKEQSEIQEQITQPSLKEETPITEKGETESPAEISTEEGIISETPKVSITEQPLKSEEEEIVQKMITEIPEHEEKEIYSTVVPKETTQYTTNIPEEISVAEESTTEFASRPSGIPGEGNCLVEGQSYSNNSAVPPANACQTSCHCISSIVQCELVQCPAPPAHLSNCMPVHTNGESCCPMYACDSTPTAELESDSHVIEPHVSGEEEIQKTVSPTEISKEVATESSTLAGEISTSKSQPVEFTIPSITSEEETVTEKQQTTLKLIETVYEQPTTARPIEQYPEEHTISSVSETSQESFSQIPEEHTVSPIIPVETTESKISEEGTTESAGLIEQPQKETGQKQIPISDEVITSTQVPAEQESHSTEESVTVPSLTEEKETSVPVEVEESSIPIEKGQEVTTTAASKAEEISMPTNEEEKPTEEEGIEQQSTFKPIEKEQPEEEKVSLKPISEEPVTIEEQEISTKSEEISTEKPGIQEEQSTSVPEIQSTTEHKPESETEKEKEHETSTETAQTEEPESQTKLPGIVPSEIETQEPIIPTAELTTLIHDHTISEEASTKEYTTIKSVEISTEESTKTESKITTQTPAIEEEHVTVAILPETEMPIEGTTKLVEESTPEVSHEETLSETTESAIEKEITEYPEKQTEPSITEHEEELSTTKLPEEKPSETESSVISEEPAKTESPEEHEKPTETSVVQELGTTQVFVEKHPETTPEIESHTPELPAEEHTQEISTSASAEEKAGEQPTTPIVKEIEPSLSEEETEQPVISESETPVAEEEHVTVPIVEQTSKFEYTIEEQTVTSPSEEKIPKDVSTVIPITSQEEQITEKTIENVKPETQLPDLAMEHTVVPEIYKKDEEKKPEIETTEEPSKEEPTTVLELTSVSEKEIEEAKEEAVTSSSIEEHTTQEEIESVVKIHETTIIPKEQKPEEGQITEATLPDHSVSEEATTVTSLAPEEYSIEPVKTEEQSTHEPEYQTTLSTVEVSQSVTEISEVEKLPPEEETATAESTEKPEEPVTKLEMSSIEKPEEIPFETEKPEEIPLETEKPEEIPLKTEKPEEIPFETEKPEEIPFETEKPIEPERETEPSEQGETTTKAIESVVTKEILPEEAVSVEVTPKVEEKPTEASTAGEEEEVHSTQSIETTSVYKEEQPTITKLEPTERPLPSEEETPAGEMQPSQPEESEEAHPTVSEEGHPSMTEEPQFTTEHVPEASTTTKIEEHPEVEEVPGTIATEGPVKVSSVKPTELPEETTTIGSEVVSEISQIPIKEEGPHPETPVEEPIIKTQPIPTELPTGEITEEPIIKTQPIPTELPTGEITEEIPEEEPIHPQEEQTHIDHFPEATVKPETDYGFHEQRPATTPHIPEYPDQSGISGEDNSHFPIPGYPNPDDDYGEDDYGGPGTCRYGGKVYVSAQQIPRDDPCDFCFCFRSDIICLQQSCPPPIPGCHEEPISGFCCPRYECPVSMATALNLTTTTTTTTTTLPPHFPAHAYKGAARRSGCQLSGHAYRVGEVIKSASNPCLRCICGNDGKMKCDPQVCSPEPMLRQMIAATTDAKRRR
ncbi:PREDICTED: titin [Atta cephalotes]|uniref:VWFC domain-containing protein n=1 Tax=Atta cephalotes TaxID=12957 RepID=A0A158NJZ8_ATTCE|nr:PREDICTED: titin [Atta cephalotes]